MTLVDAIAVAIMPAMALLPERMDTPPARAMVLAIWLQESRIEHRRQIGGPARSFGQFERIGVLDLFQHRATSALMTATMIRLAYDPVPDMCFVAIEHNDVLAAVCARLCLWKEPAPLPTRHDANEGWRQYIAQWKPGKPHPATWPEHWTAAWEAVI